MSLLSEKLRKLANRLRKEAKSQTLPRPIANPVASKAEGDLGSQEPTPSAPKPKTSASYMEKLK